MPVVEEVSVPLREDPAADAPLSPEARLPPLRGVRTLYCLRCGHRLRVDQFGRPPREHKPRRSGFGCATFLRGNASEPLLWTCRDLHRWHKVVPTDDWRKARWPA